MAKKERELPPMIPILTVGIKSGRILWDDVADNLGHVYDHACYDGQLQRRNKQSEIVNMPIRGTHKEPVIKFNKDENCESCFQKHHTLVDLKVKGNEIYCPDCGVRRPLREH